MALKGAVRLFRGSNGSTKDRALVCDNRIIQYEIKACGAVWHQVKVYSATTPLASILGVRNNGLLLVEEVEGSSDPNPLSLAHSFK
ncbi:hypothetical protein L2E82_14158 [Cichorium intybus]|uniref:Uncharacterized protein n=1 Tax=Cichorium intybus TaxID=13427 RepID=A0ACB9EZP2_CICIN|nr:hypothetical protein L2E82_14158 [Cichorium intybus]